MRTQNHSQRKSAMMGLILVFSLGACGEAPVDWQWIGGPPGPLAVTVASPRVLHLGSVVVTATGGVGRYQFAFDDGNAGGRLVPDTDLNTATYFAPSSGSARTVTFTVTSVSETAQATVDIPASGSLDTRCGGGTGFRTYEFCIDCQDQSTAVLLRNGVLDLFGSSYAPSDTPTPTARYAVRSISPTTLDPVPSRWGQTSGALRINPGRTLNVGNSIVGVTQGPDDAVFYGATRPSSGMLLGRLDSDGTQPSNFDGASNATMLFSDARYNPRGIAWNASTQRLAVPAAYQPSVQQDSVRIDLFGQNGGVGTFTAVTYAASGMTLETNSPFVLPLADGRFLAPSASHDNGTLGVPRFNANEALDTSWNGTGYYTMQTQVALSPPWGPQAAKLSENEVYLAGAKGSTIWVNAMNLADGSIVRKSSVSIGGTSHAVTAVLPQPDGGVVVLGYATQAVQQGFIVRFRRSGSGGLEPDVDAYGGFPQMEDILAGASGSNPFAVEAATLDAEGRILAVGWRSISGRKQMLAACLFP